MILGKSIYWGINKTIKRKLRAFIKESSMIKIATLRIRNWDIAWRWGTWISTLRRTCLK